VRLTQISRETSSLHYLNASACRGVLGEKVENRIGFEADQTELGDHNATACLENDVFVQEEGTRNKLFHLCITLLC
jgi:hypothetical protein